MHILFVDDSPAIKVQNAIDFLKRNTELDFTYEIIGNVEDSFSYIEEHKEEISLMVVDLGIPVNSKGEDYDSLNGMNVISYGITYAKNIPIIINSTTKMPDESEFLSNCQKMGVTIEHVQYLDGEWLLSFIKENV